MIGALICLWCGVLYWADSSNPNCELSLCCRCESLHNDRAAALGGDDSAKMGG